MNMQDVLVFEVAGSEFSVPLSIVEEVVPATQVTPIPNSPPFLLGLAAVRGKVMGVIDAAKRYRLGPGLNSFFMICYVRGNLTAVAIDRAVVAGKVPVNTLSEAEAKAQVQKTGLDEKFSQGAFELFEFPNEDSAAVTTGIRFVAVDADLFVSAEMASRIGEG